MPQFSLSNATVKRHCEKRGNKVSRGRKKGSWSPTGWELQGGRHGDGFHSEILFIDKSCCHPWGCLTWFAIWGFVAKEGLHHLICMKLSGWNTSCPAAFWVTCTLSSNKKRRSTSFECKVTVWVMRKKKYPLHNDAVQCSQSGSFPLIFDWLWVVQMDCRMYCGSSRAAKIYQNCISRDRCKELCSKDVQVCSVLPGYSRRRQGSTALWVSG